MDRERALQWCERLTQAGYPALPVKHHDGDLVTWKVAVEARVSTWASRGRDQASTGPSARLLAPMDCAPYTLVQRMILVNCNIATTSHSGATRSRRVSTTGGPARMNGPQPAPLRPQQP